jgi:hypothetical protein
MRKAGSIIFILLMGIQGLIMPSMLSAQDNEDPSREPGWDDYTSDSYTRGDQILAISLGTVFPLAFLNNGKTIEHNITPPVGGTGSLAYNYFLNSGFFLGADLTLMFLYTLGNNNLFLIPIGIRAGYQFNIWKLEFPLSVGVGIAFHRVLNSGYFGMHVRAGAAVYFRALNTWSFGISANAYWLPEWTSDSKKNVDGFFMDTTLSARYHF